MAAVNRGLMSKSFQMRSTDSIDSGFHSLSIGGHRRLSSHHHQPPARVMFKTSGDLGPSYCEMVRYQHGGQRQRSEARHRRPSHSNMVRSRSKSRDRGYRGGHRQEQFKDTELLCVLVLPCCKVNTGSMQLRSGSICYFLFLKYAWSVFCSDLLKSENTNFVPTMSWSGAFCCAVVRCWVFSCFAIGWRVSHDMS